MRLIEIFGLLCMCASAAGAWDDTIRLKTRNFAPAVADPFEGETRPVMRCRHLILRFASRPDSRVLQELAHRRIRVLAIVPDSAVMVAMEGEADIRGLGVTWAGPMDPADKISPALRAETSGVYLVEFHPDVNRQRAREIASQGGLQILDNPGLAAGDLLVTGDKDLAAALAVYDEVAYIFPARAELAVRRRVYRCPGPLIPAGVLGDYALVGAGWPKDSAGGVGLGYFFESLTPLMDADTVRGEIERALAQWALYANVTFMPAQQAAAARSIDILFASGAHGDAYPFVGSSVLAHTFYPAPPNNEPVAGDMHFNGAEAWSDGSGIDLFSVALHEAGHALGLGHSDNPDAVMYPYYHQIAGLNSDDIAAIQALYGPPSSQASPPTQPVTPPVAPPVTPTPSPGQPVSPPMGADSTPPSVTITSPAATIVATSAASEILTGTASDNVGVTVVKWSTSTGTAGTAAGTTEWSANVPLLVGTNTVTVRAYDAAGNSGWRAITIVRQ